MNVAHVCPGHHQQGPGLTPGLKAGLCWQKRCQSQALPGSWRGLPSHHRSSCFPHSSLLWRRKSRGLTTPGRAPGPTGRGRAASTGSQRADCREQSRPSDRGGGLLLFLLLPPRQPRDCQSPAGWAWVPRLLSNLKYNPLASWVEGGVQHVPGLWAAVSARGFPLNSRHHRAGGGQP